MRLPGEEKQGRGLGEREKKGNKGVWGEEWEIRGPGDGEERVKGPWGAVCVLYLTIVI